MTKPSAWKYEIATYCGHAQGSGAVLDKGEMSTAVPADKIRWTPLYEHAEKLQSELSALRAAIAPFVALMKGTNGRIPTERLSFADWHALAKAAGQASSDETAWCEHCGCGNDVAGYAHLNGCSGVTRTHASRRREPLEE